MPRGVVAAGHPVTAEAGAEILRAGGNAVYAALASMFTSFVAEPMLTGLGAGGYMLVAPPGDAPVLLDFFVEAPGRGLAPDTPHAPLRAVEVDFGAHGRFDQRAIDDRPLPSPMAHAGWAALGISGLLAAGAATVWRLRR